MSTKAVPAVPTGVREALAILRASGAILPQRELARVVNEMSDEVVGSVPSSSC